MDKLIDMKKLLLFLTAPMLFSCKPKTQPADEALYEMLNFQYDDYIARYGDKNVPNALLVKTTHSGLREMDSLSIIKMDTLFTKEDLAYIFEQAKDTTAIVLNPALLRGHNSFITQKELDTFWHECKKKDLDTCWNQFYTRYSTMGYTFYNKPLFNKAHTVALLYQDNHCGSLCGGVITFIYRKEKGKWKITGYINPGSR
jgi:hypothetical protein